MLKHVGWLLVTLVLSGCQAHPGPQPDAVGPISQARLLDNYPGFAHQYQQYQPSAEAIKAAAKLADQHILVLFGSWCHDSQQQVPALLKTLDSAGVKPAELTLLAVDQRKQEPSGQYKTYHLRYTPTFILLNGNKEIGRVVERPVKSVSQDLAQLLLKNKS